MLILSLQMKSKGLKQIKIFLKKKKKKKYQTDQPSGLSLIW